MASEMAKRLEELTGAYERQRVRLVEFKDRIRAVAGTATSPRREVTATVGRGGELTDLTFPTSAYKRMPPSELAAVIVRTVEEARQQVIAASAELIAPLLPNGLSAQRLMSGDVDVDVEAALAARESDQSQEGNKYG